MRQSSLVERLALFDFLDADDSSEQPIVRSAAECLTEVHYAGGLHALRSSLLYGKGLPVVWLDAHPDETALTDKAVHVFTSCFILCSAFRHPIKLGFLRCGRRHGWWQR